MKANIQSTRFSDSFSVANLLQHPVRNGRVLSSGGGNALGYRAATCPKNGKCSGTAPVTDRPIESVCSQYAATYTRPVLGPVFGQHPVSNGRVLSFLLAAPRGTDAYLAGAAGRLSLETHLPASQFSISEIQPWKCESAAYCAIHLSTEKKRRNNGWPWSTTDAARCTSPLVTTTSQRHGRLACTGLAGTGKVQCQRPDCCTGSVAKRSLVADLLPGDEAPDRTRQVATTNPIAAADKVPGWPSASGKSSGRTETCRPSRRWCHAPRNHRAEG